MLTYSLYMKNVIFAMNLNKQFPSRFITKTIFFNRSNKYLTSHATARSSARTQLATAIAVAMMIGHLRCEPPLADNHI